MCSWDGRKAMNEDMSSIVGENWGGGKWSHLDHGAGDGVAVVFARRFASMAYFCLRVEAADLFSSFFPVARGELVQESGYDCDVRG